MVDEDFEGAPEQPDSSTLADDAFGRLGLAGVLPPLYRRAWLLTGLDCAERFGVTPLSRDDVHALAFLADALAPVYDLVAPDRSVLKSNDSPFFPTIQWDLDRLCVQGLVEREVRFESGSDVVLYSCSRSGQRLVLELSRSPLVEAAIGYLFELVSAFARLDRRSRSKAATVDATYASTPSSGTLIDFGEWEKPADKNYSLRATRAFDAVNDRGAPFSPRERLHLYLRYLARARTLHEEDAS